MRFLTPEQIAEKFAGKHCAVVGSAPSVMENPVGLVDSHDMVVRVNNYKMGGGAGTRADAFYSFFGNSIKKTSGELERDGVTVCLCKCPNSKPIASMWHERNKKLHGIDFRKIYERRRNWWFCDTYIPSSAEFLKTFNMLGRRVPTTGFSAILDLLSFKPASLYVTGFDFFSSGIHNVNERWVPGRPDDPIGHRPDLERAWLAEAAAAARYPMTFDRRLESLLIKELA